jgi:plastocyanin
MKTKAIFASALLALALGLGACGGGSDEGSSGGETAATEESGTAPAGGAEATESETAPSGEARKSEKVEIVEFSYGPDPVVVQAGGKVIWQNVDTAPHTATADDGSFDTGTIDIGKIGSETFKQAGTYAYHCQIHPTMHGSVEVVE